jgi:hypothetical protein
MTICAATGLFRDWCTVYATNMCVACFSALLLDAVRVPGLTTLATAVAYWGTGVFWSFCLFFRVGAAFSLDYDHVLFGEVRNAGCALGRMATLAAFFNRSVHALCM